MFHSVSAVCRVDQGPRQRYTDPPHIIVINSIADYIQEIEHIITQVPE